MRDRLDRGSVVLVRFDPAEGREIRKRRPAVVVSNNAACRFDAVVQVVPLTRLPDRELRPYEALVSSSGSGLESASRAVANQIRTVSRSRVQKRLGQIDASEQAGLDQAIRTQLALG